MKDHMDGKDPIGKLLRNVDKMISIFGLLGLFITIWILSSLFIEGY